jgi:2-iminobutanoate/2-iminopropanoate deaminase
MKQAVMTDRAPKPGGPYSQAIITSGRQVYVAGQGPGNPATGKVDATTIEEQTAQVFENIKAILEAAGASMADVVRTTVYLSNMQDFQAMNAVYRRYFPEPCPARMTIGVTLGGGMLVAADAIAVLPE